MTTGSLAGSPWPFWKNYEPNANLMNVMKTSLTIIPNVSSGSPLLLLEIVQAYPLLHKGLGHLASLYLFYLLVAHYYLSYHKTMYYLQFQCLQRKPYWKPPILSFCSSLGSTLLLIARTTIDPYTCGSSRLFSGAVAGERSALGEWNLVRKHLYSVLKFSVTCHYGN